MRFVRVLATSAVAALVPALASAATITINGGAPEVFSGSEDLVLVDSSGVVTNYTVNVDPVNGDSGPYTFNLWNDSEDLIAFTLISGSIVQ